MSADVELSNRLAVPVKVVRSEVAVVGDPDGVVIGWLHGPVETVGPGVTAKLRVRGSVWREEPAWDPSPRELTLDWLPADRMAGCTVWSPETGTIRWSWPPCQASPGGPPPCPPDVPPRSGGG